MTASSVTVTTLVPTLIVSPAYLMGAIPLGTLIQSALAFQRVEGALAFCLSSYSKIAEWRAIMARLSQFEAAMQAVDTAGPAGAQGLMASITQLIVDPGKAFETKPGDSVAAEQGLITLETDKAAKATKE